MEPTTSDSEARSIWDSLIVKCCITLQEEDFSLHKFRLRFQPDLCLYYAKRNVNVFRGEEVRSRKSQVPLQESYN